jgi:RPA family protein
MENKRLPAIKTRLENVMKGKYVTQEGFNPNYILTRSGMRVSRVRVMGTIVDKFIAESGKFASLTVDDGSDTIRAKAFNGVSIVEAVEVGNEVDLIGKVREYQGEIFVMPEIIRVIEDPNEGTLRHLELEKQRSEWEKKRSAVFENEKSVSDLEELKTLMLERYGISKEETEAVLSSKVDVTPTEEKTKDDPKKKLMEIIEENDSGEGCDYQVIIEKSGLEEDVIDSAVQELLDEGSCFEPKPGKIKKL